MRGFTEAARHDLMGTPLRVTHISPGMVGGTEFSNVRLGDDTKAKAVYDNIEALSPDDVADTVEYAVSVSLLLVSFTYVHVYLILTFRMYFCVIDYSSVSCSSR